AKLLVPASVALGGKRQVALVEVVFGQRLDASVLAQLRDVFILKDADQPGYQWPLAVVAGQDGGRAGPFAGPQVPPERGNGLVLALLVAREQPYRPRPQGIDQQAISPTGTSGEQTIPGAGGAFQAAAAEEPIHGVEVVQEAVPRDRSAGFRALGAKEVEA